MCGERENERLMRRSLADYRFEQLTSLRRGQYQNDKIWPVSIKVCPVQRSGFMLELSHT